MHDACNPSYSGGLWVRSEVAAEVLMHRLHRLLEMLWDRHSHVFQDLFLALPRFIDRDILRDEHFLGQPRQGVELVHEHLEGKVEVREEGLLLKDTEGSRPIFSVDDALFPVVHVFAGTNILSAVLVEVMELAAKHPREQVDWAVVIATILQREIEPIQMLQNFVNKRALALFRDRSVLVGDDFLQVRQFPLVRVLRLRWVDQLENGVTRQPFTFEFAHFRTEGSQMREPLLPDGLMVVHSNLGSIR